MSVFYVFVKSYLKNIGHTDNTDNTDIGPSQMAVYKSRRVFPAEIKEMAEINGPSQMAGYLSGRADEQKPEKLFSMFAAPSELVC